MKRLDRSAIHAPKLIAAVLAATTAGTAHAAQITAAPTGPGGAPLAVRQASPPQRASFNPAPPPTEAQLQVGLAPGVDAGLIAATVGANLVGTFGTGSEVLSPFGPAEVVLLQLRTPAQAEAAIGVLSTLPGVVFVEGNLQVEPPEGCGAQPVTGPQQCTAAFFDATPTLPEYAEQQAVPLIGLDSSTAPNPAHATIVAVIDTGIDFSHPLIADLIHAPGYDYVLDKPIAVDLPNGLDDDQDGIVDEAFGHGTHVAGLIALANPNVRLLPYRVLDAEGTGTAYDVAQAIYQATLDGAEVINLSLSLAGPSWAVEEAIEFATDDGIAVVVAAAGNTGTYGAAYPAVYEEVVAVAALGPGDVKASFSAYGPEVDVAAPGVDLYSAMPGFQFAQWSGTSMSTAVTSGSISRLHSWSQKLDDTEASAEALVSGTISIDSANPGFDELLGSGRIHVAQAGVKLVKND